VPKRPPVRRNLVNGSRTPILVAEGPRLNAYRGEWVKLRAYTSHAAAHMALARATAQRRRRRLVRLDLERRGRALWGRQR
jgi:hypothetical protein